MSIVHVRIDDRLIHGQVATMWTNQLQATRIMVIDDKAASDETLKTSLKIATPIGVSLSILTAERAAERILSNAYQGQRVLVIVRSPEVLLQLLGKGLKFDIPVNVGNLYDTKEKIVVANSIYVNRKQIKAFLDLHEQGVAFTKQLVPSHVCEDFIPLLKTARKSL